MSIMALIIHYGSSHYIIKPAAEFFITVKIINIVVKVLLFLHMKHLFEDEKISLKDGESCEDLDSRQRYSHCLCPNGA